MVWNCCLLGALLDLQTKGLRCRLGLSVQLQVRRRKEILLLIRAAVFPVLTWAASGSRAEAGARRSLCSQTGTKLVNTTAQAAEKTAGVPCPSALPHQRARR